MVEKLTFEEAFNVLCGAKIGEGVYRDVFVCSVDPSLVVKVERETGNFQNITEHRTWVDWQLHKPVADWLAPCTRISPNGRILLQKRCVHLYPEDLPEKVPAFLTDLKWENFGRLNGKVVCLDYSFVVVNMSSRLKKASWRS